MCEREFRQPLHQVRHQLFAPPLIQFVAGANATEWRGQVIAMHANREKRIGVRKLKLLWCGWRHRK